MSETFVGRLVHVNYGYWSLAPTLEMTTLLLIKSSINQPVHFFQGMTPLLEAAAHGHVDAVRVLVELKANPTVSSDSIDP